MSFISRVSAFAATLVFMFAWFAGAPVSAQTASAPATVAAITGTIVDRDGGLPVSGATLTLRKSTGEEVAKATTNTSGVFTFPIDAAGVYYVVIAAPGYTTVRTEDIPVVPGSTSTIRSAIARATTSTSNLREIGRVSTKLSSNGALATATTINQTVSSDLVQKEGYIRIGDALGTLPGINASTSPSVGDDLSVAFRGYSDSETETLLDGHPIGPQGASTGHYSFQVSPSYAIGNTVATYGSGALGLYGTDAIGGTIDQQTIVPTKENHLELTEGIGYEGRRFTDIQATGTVLNDRLGYALVHAVDGSYGLFPPQFRTQPGLYSNTNFNNFSIANESLPQNYYPTSSNYLLRNDLLKLKYKLSNSTSFEATYTDADSWDDKSGNGDNCYFSYGLTLYNAQQTAQTPQTYPVSLTNGTIINVNCPAGRLGVTFDNKTGVCITPAQYAQNSYGPLGGGIGPWQAHRFNDYHGRFQTTFAGNTLTLDGFGNRYSTDYNRNEAGGSFDTQFYDTTGLLISDDIQSRNNALGFGYFITHQNHIGTYLDLSTGTPQFFFGANSTPGIVYGSGEGNYFLRDQYTPPGPLSVYLNAWLKRSTVTQKQTLDPRLSFVYRVTPSDVLRLTGGRADAAPAPDNLFGPVSLNQTPTNLNPTCGGLTSIGSSTNPLLQPETATDYEVAYGHRFFGDTVINVNGYVSLEKNIIFGGNVPVTQLPNVTIPASLLAQYLARISGFCGGPPSSYGLGNLSVSSSFNAGLARYQGVELTGRYRLNRQMFVDYSYDIQSAAYVDIPDQVLQNNVLIVPHSQFNGTPLHKVSAGLDYQSRGGFEARIDGYYQGLYNGYNPAQPFYYANASFSQRLNKSTTFNIGVQNLFDSNANNYLTFGTIPFLAENVYGTDTSAVQQQASQGTTQTYLLPITAVFSITHRF